MLLGLRNLQKKLENTFYLTIQILPAHADKKRITHFWLWLKTLTA
jgi:hypothetical protein